MNDFQSALFEILFANTSTEELTVERLYELAIDIAPDVLKAACKQGEQKSAEWSEQDEYNKRQVCRILREAGCSQKLQDKINSWLESFRFQPHWKPSDEQLDALLYVCKNINPPLSDKLGWDSLKTLELIYQELKKLREE